jgi:hypothetical protein
MFYSHWLITNSLISFILFRLIYTSVEKTSNLFLKNQYYIRQKQKIYLQTSARNFLYDDTQIQIKLNCANDLKQKLDNIYKFILPEGVVTEWIFRGKKLSSPKKCVVNLLTFNCLLFFCCFLLF